VDFQVDFEVAALGEGLPAARVATDVRFFPGVPADVDLESVGAHEGGSAVGTDVGAA
jgi:hypothetical protein